MLDSERRSEESRNNVVEQESAAAGTDCIAGTCLRASRELDDDVEDVGRSFGSFKLENSASWLYTKARINGSVRATRHFRLSMACAKSCEISQATLNAPAKHHTLGPRFLYHKSIKVHHGRMYYTNQTGKGFSALETRRRGQ